MLAHANVRLQSGASPAPLKSIFYDNDPAEHEQVPRKRTEPAQNGIDASRRQRAPADKVEQYDRYDPRDHDDDHENRVNRRAERHEYAEQ